MRTSINLALILALTTAALTAQQPYKVVDNWKIGGEGGWDYLLADSGADRIYLVTAEFGPAPAPTADTPHPRPPVIPGSFTVIVVGR
jgi:hypothetical protein